MCYQFLAEALLANKPYFGPALRAMQGVPERHRYLLPTLASLSSASDARQVQILEIGSWAGASTISWMAAMRHLDIPGRVTCVDPWQAYFGAEETDQHYREMNSAAREGLIFSLFQHNIRAAGFSADVEVRRGTSQAVLPDFPDNSFDVIYIDGSHRFADVTFDITQAKRLLREGGIVCGDDLEVEARELPRDELCQAIGADRDWVYSETAHRHYHPGVSGAVAQEFESVGVWNGFWAVHNHGGVWAPAKLDESRCWVPDHIRLAAERSTPDDSQNTPQLSGSYRGFNLVRYAGSVYGLRLTLGHVNLVQEAPILMERYDAADALVGESIGEVRARIDSVEISRELQNWQKAQAEQVAARLASLEKLVTEVQEMETNFATLHRDQQLLTRHIALLENGPGDPQVPCLAGEHRGFSLVHYQGRVYGLRKPLDLEELRLGEQDLLERFGADQVIAGQSLDGVRARIDVLEGLRQLRTELELVDRELSVTGSRLGQELEQTKSMLQMQARDLEKLTQTWFSRLRRALS